MSSPKGAPTERTPIDADRDSKDTGGILVLVLATVSIIALITLPIMTYTVTVFKAGEVQADRTQAVELANGGTWVAMSNERQLYDLCNGSASPLPSSIPNVTTTCQVLDTNTLRPATEMPFEVATVQADSPIPAEFANAPETYVNPNTSSDASLWLADWTPESQENKVWMPQLPVQATSDGGLRATAMPSGSTPGYATCRVFFPGTFNAPITINEPAYFTSGVYYFTEPITLEDGADVVVGNGSAAGCTTDFEAVSFANTVPDPLNMSGLGGTFVLGGDARIDIDDAGGADIRFAINQRYVSVDETSVAASSDVAIVSVNGTHEPLVGAEMLGQDLDIPGVLNIPASTVGTDGDPLAADSDYLPSTLTPKPTAPDAPTITAANDLRVGSTGWLRVEWSLPNDNGSLIESYTVTDSVSGQTCTSWAPTLPDTSVQQACAISSIPDNTVAQLSVTATNGVGTSAPSSTFTAPMVNSSGGGTLSDPVYWPQAPQNVQAGVAYDDGLEVTWDPPGSDGGLPLVGYVVEAVEQVSGDVTTCGAWWDELTCVLPTGAGGLVPGLEYDIEVWGILRDGRTGTIYGQDGSGPGHGTMPSSLIFNLGSGPAPVQVAATASPRVPSPIVDLRTTTSTNLTVEINGYVSVPQGRVAISAATPPNVAISMTGGMLAGTIDLDPAGVPTGGLEIIFDNPVAQKRVRIISTSSGDATARSDAIIQVNRSGSLAINSWVVQ